MGGLSLASTSTTIIDINSNSLATDVLNVTALGDDLAKAREHAYEAVRTIRFAGGVYRTDIAQGIVEAGGP